MAGEHIPLRDGAISASRLESWASCGFRYLLSYELGLGARDDPEAIVSIGALDRGSALHKILERFVAGGTKRAGGASPSLRWADERRAELYRLADEVFEELARSGRTGRNLFWRQTRRDLEQTLDQFLTDADEWRRGLGLTPIEVEWTLAMGEAPALTIDLDDGRTLAFRGSIDRIDETAAGTLEISDYKTGSAKKPLALVKEDADPVLGGTLLQLGIYAEAAHQHLAADSDAPVRRQTPRHRYRLAGAGEYRHRLLCGQSVGDRGHEARRFGLLAPPWPVLPSVWSIRPSRFSPGKG